MGTDNSTDGMVALLPTTSDWCKIKLPHLTLVYLGPIADLPATAFNELAKKAASVAMVTSPLSAKVMYHEVLGQEEKVDTLCLEPTTELTALRHFFDEWDASEFDFHPHVTVGPANGLTPEITPMYLTFDRIMVAWGDQDLTWFLKRSGY